MKFKDKLKYLASTNYVIPVITPVRAYESTESPDSLSPIERIELSGFIRELLNKVANLSHLHERLEHPYETLAELEQRRLCRDQIYRLLVELGLNR